MIDFSKKIAVLNTVKKVNPVEIYSTLDRKSDVGPLRPIQERVLNKWYNNRRNDSDIIVKLHTGAGKTLIGLLMALSYINNNEGPVMYVCPNIYLMQQTCSDANKFGIPFCVVDNENNIPDDFINGKKVLITYVQKVFNGLSIFGIGTRSQTVGCIILDDSHACMESIAASCTIRINIDENKDIYQKLKSLFEDDLKNQGLGTYLDINNGNSDSLMAIPYWNWYDKSEDVSKILSKNIDKKCIKFAWPIIKNQIDMCQAYVSSKNIEISPLCTPIEMFNIFNKANHRILMSATTQEDTFFIKGLGMSIESVKNPLFDDAYKWSGEKMILIPQLICENTTLDAIKDVLLKTQNKKFGKAVLTPSFSKAKEYENYGGVVANMPGNNMFQAIKEHKQNLENSIIVFANRYDGIDLPDDYCRILFIDSLPYYDLLSDRYEEQCNSSSDIVKIKTIQKIEQALGRSVRGEKDYSVVIVFGNDLIKYLKGIDNTKYFSSETKKQLEIGLNVSKMVKEDAENNETFALVSIINQCLERDEGWKAYYASNMDEIENNDNNKNDLYNLLYNEREAYLAYKSNRIEDACSLIQVIINKCNNEEERGWYTQLKAKYKYVNSKYSANEIQISAFNMNNELLKPISGISYSKLVPLDEKRAISIQKKLLKFNNYFDLSIELEDILSKLSFGTEANTFEKTVQVIGELLGFASQRPDKSIRKGPDNLWCDDLGNYLLIECKSEVLIERDFIKKTEAGQMDQHCAWFEDEYNISDYYNIMIIPTNRLADDAYFSNNTKIITTSELHKLKSSIKRFFSEFKEYDFRSVTSEKISNLIVSYKFTIDEFINNYTIDALKN